MIDDQQLIRKLGSLREASSPDMKWASEMHISIAASWERILAARSAESSHRHAAMVSGISRFIEVFAGLHHRALALLVVGVFVVVGVAGAEVKHARPGDFFYPAKQTARKVSLMFARNEEDRIVVEIGNVHKTIDDLNFVITDPIMADARGRTADIVRSTLSSAESESAKIHERLKGLAEDAARQSEYARVAVQVVNESTQILARLNAVASSLPEASLAVVQAKAKFQEADVVALKALGNLAQEDAQGEIKTAVEGRLALLVEEASRIGEKTQNAMNESGTAAVEINAARGSIAEAEELVRQGNVQAAVGRVHLAVTALSSAEKALLAIGGGKVIESAEDVNAVHEADKGGEATDDESGLLSAMNATTTPSGTSEVAAPWVQETPVPRLEPQENGLPKEAQPQPEEDPESMSFSVGQ